MVAITVTVAEAGLAVMGEWHPAQVEAKVGPQCRVVGESMPGQGTERMSCAFLRRGGREAHRPLSQRPYRHMEGAA